MVCGNFKAKCTRVSEKKKRQQSAREKLMIITYHEKGHSKRSTADKFGIEPKQLRDWINNKDKLISVTPYVQKLNTGVYLKFLYIEGKLIEQFTEARSQLKTVTQFIIQIKTHLLAKKYHTNQNILM